MTLVTLLDCAEVGISGEPELLLQMKEDLRKNENQKQLDLQNFDQN